MPTRLLVPLDGSDLSERALPFATALARREDGEVILVRAALAPLFSTDPLEEQAEETGEAERELAAVAQRLESEGIKTDKRIYFDDPAPSIVRAAEMLQADIIVMSTHGRSGIGRWIYGSVADQVLRTAKRPVLLVPASVNVSWDTAADDERTVLVPLDGSEIAESVLDEASQLADLLDAGLLLLQIIPQPVYTSPEGFVYSGMDIDEILADAQGYLDGVAKRLPKQKRPVKTRVIIGEPTVLIAEEARTERALAIVMATHGRSGIARLVLGSAATGTVQRSPAPVLLIRPAALDATESAPVPTIGEPRETTGPITLTLSADEVDLVRRGLEGLLATSSREEHLAEPIHKLLDRLK